MAESSTDLGPPTGYRQDGSPWWLRAPEPFTSTGQRGNQAAVTHGAHSERVVAPVAQYRRADLIARAEWC